jgi:hypothetical protein
VTGDWPDLTLLGEADYLGNIGIPAVLLLWFLTYGLGEEVGWRGFALPRMQRTRPAANAALLLGLLWAGWHLPAFLYRDTYTEMGLLGFPMFAVSVVFASVVFAWLYNSTGGSLLLVILFHIFFNWLSVSEAGGQYVGILMTVPVILWSIYVVRRYQPENASPLAKQVAKDLSETLKWITTDSRDGSQKSCEPQVYADMVICVHLCSLVAVWVSIGHQRFVSDGFIHCPFESVHDSFDLRLRSVKIDQQA